MNLEHHGAEEIVQHLEQLEREGVPGLMRDALEEVDAAFARVQSEHYRSLKGRYDKTGRLRTSLTSTTHPEHISHVSGSRIILGTRVPYAPELQARSGRKYGPVIRMQGDDVQRVIIDPIREVLGARWRA